MYKIICVGKIKEDYLTSGILEYKKRIEGFQKIEILELKEINTPDILKNIESEGQEILSKIKPDDYIITLEIEGKMLNSVELSKNLANLATYGKSKIVFVIGGSNGLSEMVKKRSNYALSFSKMTFPHQLIRVFLLEQIFRAFKIQKGETYHR